MAHDPILHIKDSIYFEVPRALWWPYKSLEGVPGWLKEAHPHATLEDFNRDLAGKYIIPQPLGTPRNLYEREKGFLITKFMVIEFDRNEKRIVLSHTRLWEQGKMEEKEALKKEARAEADKTRKAVKNLQSKVEKPTLGDLGALASIKEKLKQEEKGQSGGEQGAQH